MLLRLAGDSTNNFVLVDTQKTLAPRDWANELHPRPDGFRKLADKFLAVLKGKFRGRI